MNDPTPAQLLWGIGALVLALSALSARRLTIGAVVRSLLGWLLIAAVAWAVLLHRQEIGEWLGKIGERIGIEEQRVEGDTVRIRQSVDGHFWARVRINGIERRMLVDSGATITALSPETARAAGIDTRGGLPAIINTAGGTIRATRGSIETLSLAGKLETRDLGVVVAPTFVGVEVLGMNFLSRLGSWRVEGNTLILEPKRADENETEGRNSADQAVTLHNVDYRSWSDAA